MKLLNRIISQEKWATAFFLLLTFSVSYSQPCIPANAGGNCIYYITNVTAPGTTLNNSSGCTGHYTAYPSTGSTTANFISGNTYTISMTSNGTEQMFFYVWCDFNGDNVFDSGFEQIAYNLVAPAGGAPISATFTVPSLASGGQVTLRVRAFRWYSVVNLGYVITPCASYGAGETEDYIVSIIPNGPPNCDPLVIIPNPSFEGPPNPGYGGMPSNREGLQLTGNWFNANFQSTSDYHNGGVEWTNPPQPLPNGTGWIGAHITQGYKESFGTCLSNPFLAGVTYSIEIDVASDNQPQDPMTDNAPPTWGPIDLTIYGNATCGSYPFGVNGGTCPSTVSPAWMILTSTNYTPTNSWNTVTFTFTPTVNINSIIIGGPCQVPNSYPFNPSYSLSPYFYFDNIVVTTPFDISQTGSICTNDLVLTSSTINVANAVYQWYLNNVPISGQTSNTLNVSANGLPAGMYTLYAQFSGTCVQDSITVSTSPQPISISYSSNTYCQNTSSETPTITGATNGTFSVIPSGLVIDPASGEIDLSSPANTYVISYITPSVCEDTATFSLTIGASNSADFSYSGPYCQGGANPLPTLSPGSSAGVFTSVPPGLVFVNSTTGEVDLSASNPGTYTVTNTVPASVSCPAASATTIIVITDGNSADFSFSGPYCQGGTNPLPTLSPGSSTGTFTSTPIGLVFVSAVTGEVDLSASTPGTYTVTNTVAASGGCPEVSSTATITITNGNEADFSYSGPYCINDTDPTATLDPGSSAGNFTSIPAGLVFLDPTTGEVDLSASTPGTYTVTNTVAASGSCPQVSATNTIMIVPLQNASFSYPNNSYCQSANTAVPTINGTAGGDFTVTPTGLIIDDATGEIDLSSPAGTYTITYTTPGPCENSSSQVVQITASLFITVSSTEICEGEVATLNAVPSVSGGTYSWNPGGQGSSSVDVNPNQTTSYTVTYTLNGCAASGTGTVAVNPIPTPIISTPYTTISEGETIQLTVGSADSYLWNTGQTGQTISISPIENTTYCVEVTDNGCSNEACILIQIGCESLVYAPNCITANGDLINDEFLVQGDCLSEFNLLIFNRWGELIFETFDISESWNGTYKGKPVSDGVYTYLIRARGVDNKFYDLQGFVTVLR